MINAQRRYDNITCVDCGMSINVQQNTDGGRGRYHADHTHSTFCCCWLKFHSPRTWCCRTSSDKRACSLLILILSFHKLFRSIFRSIPHSSFYTMPVHMLIITSCTCSWRCNGLELCTRRISCSHAFWCFPRPILAIFHIANVFLSGFPFFFITEVLAKYLSQWALRPWVVNVVKVVMSIRPWVDICVKIRYSHWQPLHVSVCMWMRKGRSDICVDNQCVCMWMGKS